MKLIIIIIAAVFFSRCYVPDTGNLSSKSQTRSTKLETLNIKPSKAESETLTFPNGAPSGKLSNFKPDSLELKFIKAGLANIQDLDSTIRVELRYATTNNFTNTILYKKLNKAYMQPDVANRLLSAQLELKKRHPGHALKIWDAARPLSVQKQLWEKVKSLGTDKLKYLSNPNAGSVHNYGAALDITIVNETGVELNMGTDFDHFGEEAHPEKEKEMLATGKITMEQVKNRQLLREVMRYAGFFNIQSEWWHFNACTLEAAKTKYTLID